MDKPRDLQKLIDAEQCDIVPVTSNFDYGYWSAGDVIKAVIGRDEADKEAVTVFETVGHIAHFNLPDYQLPYKALIGQVIVDKYPGIKTVVTKTDNIETQFRFFKMEVIGGVDNMITEVFENGCKFKLDYSALYWNSRLQTEHARIVAGIKPGEYVCKWHSFVAAND